MKATSLPPTFPRTPASTSANDIDLCRLEPFLANVLHHRQWRRGGRSGLLSPAASFGELGPFVRPLAMTQPRRSVASLMSGFLFCRATRGSTFDKALNHVPSTGDGANVGRAGQSAAAWGTGVAK